MVHQLDLFVFIVGLETLLPVTIEDLKTVGHLKESILEKKKNDLKDVDADRLTLYHVKIPSGKTLGQLVAQAVDGAEPLMSFTPLSEIFTTNPPAKTISIVVKLGNTMGIPTLVHMGGSRLGPCRNLRRYLH
ncbi:hypothetical protein BC827DRAFT_210693 [Russula dissimulans]|nr:hypothetical protein BC827DRAFT_210693 [Russula dissimulans]